MTDLDILHFEQLKLEVQKQFLRNHTASDEDISNWKGIDIVYFQEDLQKRAKGSISEKSFYTYFKNSPVTKIPRIDILNMLSVYAGHVSWYNFKKQHLYTNEILTKLTEPDKPSTKFLKNLVDDIPDDFVAPEIKSKKKPHQPNIVPEDQESRAEFAAEKIIAPITEKTHKPKRKILVGFGTFIFLSLTIWAAIQFLFTSKDYTFTFIDADRNSTIYNELDVKILKHNESPILFKVKPNEPFIYKNPEGKIMTMVVSSPYYKTDTIIRNLETAPKHEHIELKPNDYAIMLYYYSNAIQEDIKRKRERLNYLISSDALIYQIYDNDKYGIETLNKNRYINLVTTPTTSLKNMEVIDTQMKNGKIVLIKFRIVSHEDLH